MYCVTEHCKFYPSLLDLIINLGALPVVEREGHRALVSNEMKKMARK